MELLDDTIEVGGDLSKENIKEIFSLRQEHSKAKKAINNARTALAIICFFSIVSLMVIFGSYSDPLVIGIAAGLIVIFGICAATPPEYAKISLPIALGLYSLDLIASLYQATPLVIFGLFIKGFFIYFLVLGVRAAFKYNNILKKMKRLNVTPYST